MRRGLKIENYIYKGWYCFLFKRLRHVGHCLICWKEACRQSVQKMCPQTVEEMVRPAFLISSNASKQIGHEKPLLFSSHFFWRESSTSNIWEPDELQERSREIQGIPPWRERGSLEKVDWEKFLFEQDWEEETLEELVPTELDDTESTKYEARDRRKVEEFDNLDNIEKFGVLLDDGSAFLEWYHEEGHCTESEANKMGASVEKEEGTSL